MKPNPLFDIDFYKAGHRQQYPEGTDLVYSNFTPRSSHLAKGQLLPDFDDRVVFFGMQAYIIDTLIDKWDEGFFNRDKAVVVAEYKAMMDNCLGPDAIPVDHIEALHDLGYLPIKIKALPEGSRVNIKVPMFTIVNTHPDFFWLVNYLETSISAELWKTCTSATIAYEFKRLVNDFAKRTGADPFFTLIQCHDFSSRGMSGMRDAAFTGMGHLTSFIGTDSVSSVNAINNLYAPIEAYDMPIGVSVPATEHSVMCMGQKESEVATFRRLITETYPTGVVSIVSDTWDFWKVITQYTEELKEEILNREPDEMGLAKVVFRPDSGDPVKIICGDPDAPVGSPEYKGAVECLYEIFGGDVNGEGFRTLNQRVGVIYGDSITLKRAQAILERLALKNFASDNIVFGVGSYTYQFVTRDTFGFAIKATYGEVNGEGREIFKDPKTDSGVKKSLRGMIRVDATSDGFKATDQVDAEGEAGGLLRTVYEDGKAMNYQSIADIREVLANG